MESNINNILIIGSGPAGLTAAIYAARANLNPIVVAGRTFGGQLMFTTEVENFPGFPEGIQGPELMDKMIKQAERFNTEFIYENATAVDFSKRPFKVHTENRELYAKSIVIATGADANWLNIPSEQKLRGKGVSACATCDGFFFRGKEVVVIGGGDSAMEEANFLTKFATSVTIVHRRDEFRASKIMLERARKNPKITFITNVTVDEILGENAVEGVMVKDNLSGVTKVISAEGVFLAIGHTPSTKVFKDTGLDLDEKGYVKITEKSFTNIPGVFMAGDVGDSRYRQAVTAAGMGCMAALDAEKYLEAQE
ncbi:MAG TPA: thioredoxin-disulfide reductase [Patescibacteria group bacterium]|nr:thioredoxin-disulfide reductase [Patescibacteria group bacterium]